MDKGLFNLDAGLSIQELEERNELTAAVPAEFAETAKDDDNDTTIIRCGGNCEGDC